MPSALEAGERCYPTTRKPSRTILITFTTLMVVFVFTRPGDYTGLARDITGTLENQWCAWTELLGNDCDRWTHARRIIDEAKELGHELRSRISATPTPEDAEPRQD